MFKNEFDANNSRFQCASIKPVRAMPKAYTMPIFGILKAAAIFVMIAAIVKAIL